ncbi:hypothetical protein FRB94_003561 [Tulasnella sp. JGI-2019a]|nr:hypothetical protein FRB94_003561 [Tulasnella sp. JGI-2019a]
MLLHATSKGKGKNKFHVQPARIKKGHFEARTISNFDWPVLTPTTSSSSPTSTSIDGVLIYGLSSADRRRFKLLHPQYQPSNEDVASGKSQPFVALFTRTLIRACTRDGSMVDATAFVWRDDATANTGLRLITDEEERTSHLARKRTTNLDSYPFRLFGNEGLL